MHTELSNYGVCVSASAELRWSENRRYSYSVLGSCRYRGHTSRPVIIEYEKFFSSQFLQEEFFDADKRRPLFRIELPPPGDFLFLFFPPYSKSSRILFLGFC